MVSSRIQLLALGLYRLAEVWVADGTLHDQLDRRTKQRLQIFLQAEKSRGIAARRQGIELDQKVVIATGPGLAPSRRAEHCQPAHAVAATQRDQALPMGLQMLQRWRGDVNGGSMTRGDAGGAISP